MPFSSALPEDSHAIWVAGCSDVRDDREIVHVGGTGVSETVLVTDGFDVDNLTGDGWKAIHKNIAIAAPKPAPAQHYGLCLLSPVARDTLC